MDSFVVSSMSSDQLQPEFEHKPPGKHLRLFFLLLLLATLASAAATTYLLVSGRKETVSVVSSPLPNAAVNPFGSAPVEANPFADNTQATAPGDGNPFTDTQGTNPFDAFETGATSSTGVVNPF